MPQVLVPHLPLPIIPPLELRELYAFNFGTDSRDFSEREWHEIRISPGMTAEQVYRKLPSAPGFEFGGYLTKTRIRYACFDEKRSNTIGTKSCTFHSHPTGLAGCEPDIPSASDLYCFLWRRTMRAITVGREQIWVFDKTKKTLPVIRNFAKWEQENMVAEFKKLEAGQSTDPVFDFPSVSVKALGLDWPRNAGDVTDKFRNEWPSLLRKVLRIKVTLWNR